jgi:hypothetical protein
VTALLVLEDGTLLEGEAYGGIGTAVGELVFTTSMTGYQEIVTDPSFAGQMITFTQPMIGNYGVESDASESDRPQARAVIVREGRNAAPAGRVGFSDWLAEHDVIGIQGLDTRMLTRRLRDGGTLRAAVCSDGTPLPELLALIGGEPEMAGQALAGQVSCRRAAELPALAPERAHVAVLDYGVKGSIVRILRECGARVTVLPWDATAEQVLEVRPDGVLLGNGPGDPAALPGCVSGSALAISCWAGHWAWRRSSSGSATAAPTTRCWTSTRGACWSRPRTTASQCACPIGEATSRPISGRPASPMSRSTTAPSRAWRCGSYPPGRCSSTPRPAPGHTTPARRWNGSWGR